MCDIIFSVSHLIGDEKKRRIKVYRGCDDEFGTGPTIYRSPDEIRLDIYEAKLAIEKINERLNIRSLTFEMISDDKELSAREVVSVLEDMLAEAEEALLELSGYKEELKELEEELYLVKCEIGI